ncbi:MAG: 3-hydroxybutyryl-CoA dehydrogenase, partial [Bacteroidetes bacterium]|nr:3-hydroxybutyryl-CoA dehydrogenase [Bacteroidota bacterium]
LSSKQLLYREIELLAPENTIFASNTSSLSIAALASVLKNPANFVGLHFFNPVPLMKLVEIIPALQTHPSLIATLQKLMQDWGKVPVLAKDTPGFIVNKVARPFYGEALRIYEEGIASFAEIDYSMKNYGGFRMGPFELMDFIGNDINYAVTESVFLAFYFDPRYKPAFAQKKMVDANWLGRKTAKGYYTYPLENEATPAILPDETKAKAIFERVLAMLINEAADTLFWQIATAEDIDTAMRYGTNYPKGLLQWANDWGIANVVSYMDNLYETYREDRYRCSPLLRKMASENKLFFQA